MQEVRGSNPLSSTQVRPGPPPGHRRSPRRHAAPSAGPAIRTRQETTEEQLPCNEKRGQEGRPVVSPARSKSARKHPHLRKRLNSPALRSKALLRLKQVSRRVSAKA